MVPHNAVRLGKQHKMMSSTWPSYIVPHIAVVMVRSGSHLVPANSDDLLNPKKTLWFTVRLSYPEFSVYEMDYDIVAVRNEKFYRVSKPNGRSRLRFGKKAADAVLKGIQTYLKNNGYGT